MCVHLYIYVCVHLSVHVYKSVGVHLSMYVHVCIYECRGVGVCIATVIMRRSQQVCDSFFPLWILGISSGHLAVIS